MQSRGLLAIRFRSNIPFFVVALCLRALDEHENVSMGRCAHHARRRGAFCETTKRDTYRSPADEQELDLRDAKCCDV